MFYGLQEKAATTDYNESLYIYLPVHYLLVLESPTPGNVPQHKRGSSASLSHVEDSMFRSAQSSNSLTKFETQSLRSIATTPEEVSVNDSPTRYATMPNRGKNKQKKVAIVRY